MYKIWTVTRRELSSYFDSPIAYIVIVSFLLVAGWMFFSMVFLVGRADLRGFFQPSLFSPALLLLILAPAITMRLLAEERKQGTLELLTSLPISDAQVILGKFFAALLLTAIALAGTAVYAITIAFIGPLDVGPVLAGYLGMLLYSAALLSIGLMCSTLTDNQIVSFIVAFLISAALYYAYWLQFFFPQSLAALVDFLSVSAHLSNMARGVIDSRDVVYYLSLTAGALFVAQRALARQHA